MKLMRNITTDGFCKYAAIRNDKIAQLSDGEQAIARGAMEMLAKIGVLENPKIGDTEEFFLIKMKDIHAAAALWAYAADAEVNGDSELSQDVYELSRRASARTDSKQPD